MDVCLTGMSAFLHHLAARQLSIKRTASCDLQEEEHQASKEQHAEDQDQRRAQNQNQDQDQEKIPDPQTVGTLFSSYDLFFFSFIFSTLFLILLPQVPQCIFSSPDISTGMQCVRCPAILALMALVLCGPGVSSQLDRDQDQYQNQDLDLELRHHRLLQRARSAGLLSQVREPTTNQKAPFLMKKIHCRHLFGLLFSLKVLITALQKPKMSFQIIVNVWKFNCKEDVLFDV